MADNSTTSEPNELPKRNIKGNNCRLFAQGYCKYGDTCKFLHIAKDTLKEKKASEERDSTTTLNSTAKTVGQQYLVSSHTDHTAVFKKAETQLINGTNTPLDPTAVKSQSLSVGQSVTDHSGMAVEIQPKAEKLCRTFMSGHCKRGKGCRFKHDQEARTQQRERRNTQESVQKAEQQQRRESILNARRAEQLAQKVERTKKKASATIQRIVLGSALVTIAAGLEISDIISGFDSCRIRINHLPLDAKEHEIISLFLQQGIDPTSIFLKAVKVIPNSHIEAEILTKAEIGQVIVFALDGLEFRNEKLQCSVYENAASDAMETWNKADSKVLTISGRSPSVTMIANYDTDEQVQWAIRHKDQQMYSGKKIKVEQNSRPHAAAQINYIPTSVKISGLSFGATEEDVQQFMEAQSIRTLKSNAYSINEVVSNLRNHLLGLPKSGMLSFEVKSLDEDEFITVEARFESWEHAKAALDSIEARRLSLLPLRTFRLSDPFGYSSRIPLVQYNAQKNQWNSLIKDWESTQKLAHIYVRTVNRYAFINVRGRDKKVVGTLKVKVENLAKGERLEAKYWHRSFSDRKGTIFLQEVHTKTGALVLADWRLHALKLFGEKSACQKAIKLLTNEIDRLATLDYSVELKPRSVKYFIKKGFDILKEELGEESVSLDLTASPCKVTVTGGEEARHTLNRLVKESFDNLSLIPPSKLVNACPICTDEVTHPIELGCGHTYCTSCFRHYLGSGSSTKSFPLKCMGNDANCQIPVALPIVQSFLTDTQFNSLLEIAVESYVDKHPDKFRYCTTPDCIQIYTCRTQESFSQCPACFALVCTACHEEAHEGMTCAENKIHKDPNEQERLNEVWAREHGAQKCPRCDVWIQKNEGCNHMTCKCGAHICWKCMKIFERDVIYTHLNTAHGGVFDIPREIGLNRNREIVDQVRRPVEPEMRHVLYQEPTLPPRPREREIPVQQERTDAQRTQVPQPRPTYLQGLQNVQRIENERQDARRRTMTETKREDSSWCVIS